MNQAFFEKLIVHQNGEITHEYAEPFKILLDPELPSRLAANAASTEPSSEEESGSWEDNGGPARRDAAGSNFEVMVEHSGIEPLTS